MKYTEDSREKAISKVSEETGIKVKFGTRRPEKDQAWIWALSLSGIEYGIIGYYDDLKYYQGDESIFKADRIAKRLPKDKGDALIEFVKQSNSRMERGI